MKRMHTNEQIKDLSKAELESNGIVISPSGISIAGSLEAGELLEAMGDGYSYDTGEGSEYYEVDTTYAGIVKTGNKITFVALVEITPLQDITTGMYVNASVFNIPESIGAKLIPYLIGITPLLSAGLMPLYYDYADTFKTHSYMFEKISNTQIKARVYAKATLETGKKYIGRFEQTFLLSDSLAD